MKVGNFTVYKSFCGSVDIWVKESPCGGFVIQSLMLACNMGMFCYLAYLSIDVWIKIVISLLTAINCAVFIRLCFSDPGVPPQILNKLSGGPNLPEN